MSTNAKIIGSIVVLTIVILFGSVFLFSNQQSQETQVPKDQIVAQNGLHWHPQLSISIKRRQQEISKDIGIGTIHQPIHTHDASGTLHMEMNGLITKEETKLGNFFRIWGKEFNPNKLFDNTNGSEGTVKMTVNGQENTEFENYLMKDKDRIEIKYE